MNDRESTKKSSLGGAYRLSSEAVAHLGAGTERRIILRAMRTGLWTWPAFVALDAYMCFWAYPRAPFAVFVTYRVVVEAMFLAVYYACLQERVSVVRLFRWLGVTFTITAVTISLMAIHLDGIRSPYMHGISIVALVWAALVPTDWRRSLPTLLPVGLAFPVVMGIGAAVSPAARADWITRDALTVFGSNYVFVLASSSLGVILGQMVWSAQQQTRKIGSYELKELLGRGGMGEVWRAEHHLLARHAAIKVIRPEALGGDRGSREVVVARFQREAQATASLGSPHTIELYDFGISDTGAFFYVMELLVGCTAQDLVQHFGPQPAARVVYLLEQLCDSLGEAHAAGLVHRDIKPSNIHVCRVGREYDFVKLLDFGLVKFRRAGEELDALMTSDHLAGTPAYMAPEAVLGKAEVDRRVDVYALGCVAYYLLTGQLVFEGETPMQVLMHHVHDPAAPPSTRTSNAIPKALDNLVVQCLEKDPARRPQDADHLLDALASCRDARPWDRDRARAWWQANLSELCAPAAPPG